MVEVLYSPIITDKLETKKKKNSKKTITGQDATPVIVNGNIFEGAVVSFGRMNPPTKGHELLVSKILEIAEQNNMEPMMFVSKSNDIKNNPLLYEDKIRFARIAFGDVIKESEIINNPIDMLKEVNKTYNSVILVLGEDRINELKDRIEKLNGKIFNFKSIQFVNAGSRNILSEEIDGISASKTRNYIKENNFEKFLDCIPNSLLLYAEEIYNLTKIGMKCDDILSEELTAQDRIKKGLTLRRYEGKIERARIIALQRRATTKKLISRSRHHAILLLRSRLAGNTGTNYANLPPSIKNQVDKKIQNARGAVIKLSTKLLPQIRKLENDRFKNKINNKLNESELKELIQILINT